MITLDGSINVVSINEFNSLSNNNTFTWITIAPTATIHMLRITNSNVLLVETQTGLNISDLAIIKYIPSIIDKIIFYIRSVEGTGIPLAGIPLAGITKASPSYRFSNCIGIQDSIVFGACGYISTSGVTTTTTENVFVNISGMYQASTYNERCSTNVAGNITYIGANPITASVQCKISFHGDSGAHKCIFAIWYKPASESSFTMLSDSQIYVTAQSSNFVYCMTEGICTLNTKDSVKAMVNTTDAAGNTLVLTYLSDH